MGRETTIWPSSNATVISPLMRSSSWPLGPLTATRPGAISTSTPEGVKVTVNDPTHITITGPDKQKVGQFAAEVRKVRPPEPYKGKGIRYEGEYVQRKVGKRA